MMNPVVNRRPLILQLSLVVIVLIAATGLALGITPGEKTIFPGVSVNGQYVGGLTGPEAAELLRKRFNEYIRIGYIQLQYDKKSWLLPYDDLGVVYDFPATVEEALETGDKGSVIQNALSKVRTYYSKPNLALYYEIDDDKLDQILSAISSEIDITAQNASICMYYGKIKVLPAVTGRTLNINSARQKIENALGRLDTSTIVLDVETHSPELNSDVLEEINGSLGIGMTTVTRSKRLNYLALESAVTTLNGLVVKPGKEFSFNLAVGHGLKELMYHYGTVIKIGRRTALITGGGTSQAASTLYQAVLNSGLKVTERYGHINPGNIPRGQDAAVVMGKLDFKFENNTKYPIYIIAEIKDDKMIVNLMGVKKEGQPPQVTDKNNMSTGSAGL